MSEQSLKGRVRASTKKAFKNAIAKGHVRDAGDKVDVVVPKGDLNEPSFRHGQGGERDFVLPGNKQHQAGDLIDKPPSGGGGRGSNGSPDGDGEDDFVFTLTKEEFLDLFFEDLALPNLTKLSSASATQFQRVTAGIVRDGLPAKRHLLQSFRTRIPRVSSMSSGHYKEILALQVSQLDILEKYGCVTPEHRQIAEDHPDPSKAMTTKAKVQDLADVLGKLRDNQEFINSVTEEDRDALALLDNRITAVYNSMEVDVPQWDPSDMRYRSSKAVPKPNTKAVMFCLMDVSASMTEDLKSLAKRFFILLNLFLERNYNEVDLVFVRHTSSAMEVDEHEFFYGTHTGGTVVSTAIHEMQKIIKERYPLNEWNIYGAQASDGDNFDIDNPSAVSALQSTLESLQGFFYIEVSEGERRRGSQETTLWGAYNEAKAAGKFPRFWMAKVTKPADIFPVFRELFSSKPATAQWGQVTRPKVS